MASKSNHMEYSIWQYIESSGVDSKALHMTSEKRHMEYSIWSLFDAIWSTPCGHYFLPYGVLHMVTVEFIFSRGMATMPRMVAVSKTVNILRRVIIPRMVTISKTSTIC